MASGPYPCARFPRAIRKITRLPRLCLTLIWDRSSFSSPLLGNQADIEAVAASGLFDRKWYLEHNNDVRRARVDPLVHYVLFGGTEGRDPNPLFDSDWYLQQNSDVRAASINPLLHYCSMALLKVETPTRYSTPTGILQQSRGIRIGRCSPKVDRHIIECLV